MFTPEFICYEPLSESLNKTCGQIVLFFLQMTNVTPEYVAEIIDKFEVSDENKQRGVMGIEGSFLFPLFLPLFFFFPLSLVMCLFSLPHVFSS